MEDRGLGNRPRIDHLTRLRCGERWIPVFHRKLRLTAMRDIGIEANLVSLRHARPYLFDAAPYLRTEDDARQPAGLLVQNPVEFVEPRLIDALRRSPHQRVRVEAVQH